MTPNPCDDEALESTVVSYDDAPDECTLYPANVDDRQRTTAWISAAEGSFVAVVRWR